MTYLVLTRHGESEWNKLNKFTGWIDVELSEKGKSEATQAGLYILEREIRFDMAYTSYLKRAIHTAYSVLDELGLAWIPLIKAWQLNERHYGALQGLNKADTAAKYGDEQVHIWRRSFDVRPPMLEVAISDKDPLWYRQVPAELFPKAESLKDTIERALPYFHAEIEPQLQVGKNILIAAHGNSLRAIIKHIEGISDEDIMKLELATGAPRIYEVKEGKYRLL